MSTHTHTHTHTRYTLFIMPHLGSEIFGIIEVSFCYREILISLYKQVASVINLLKVAEQFIVNKE
jgi:hypothetical protein